MEIRILKYFLTVISEGSITRAADVLHITQPTLSRQLAQMEEELGVSLFERGSRKIRLTNEGFLLKRRALEIVELVDKAESELRMDDRTLSGKVSMGMGELRASRDVARIIAAFRREHPLVCFSITTSDADQIKERMDRGLTDVGLLLEPADIEKYDFIRMPSREQWIALVRADSPLASLERVSARDLSRHPIIIPSRPAVINEVASWFGRYYRRLTVSMACNLSTNASVMVHAGLGCAITLAGSLPFLDSSELAMKPLDPPLEASTVLVWKKHLPSSPVAQRFTEFARGYLLSGASAETGEDALADGGEEPPEEALAPEA